MGNDLSLNIELGPLFTVVIDQPAVAEKLTLEVGAKTSSLLAAGANVPLPYTYVTVTAGSDISLFRAVDVSGLHVEPITETRLSAYAGVSSVAVVVGMPVKLIVKGLISENSWTWTPDAPIFIGAGGVLTQTPGSLPMRRIGWAISATQINLDVYPIIGA